MIAVRFDREHRLARRTSRAVRRPLGAIADRGCASQRAWPGGRAAFAAARRSAGGGRSAAWIGPDPRRLLRLHRAARSCSPPWSAPEQEDVTARARLRRGHVRGDRGRRADRRRRADQRGDLLPRLLLRRPAAARCRSAAAALISAGVWGLFHLTDANSGRRRSSSRSSGSCSAWLYERTGSLWPTIAVHAFNNAIAFTLLTS